MDIFYIFFFNLLNYYCTAWTCVSCCLRDPDQKHGALATGQNNIYLNHCFGVNTTHFVQSWSGVARDKSSSCQTGNIFWTLMTRGRGILGMARNTLLIHETGLTLVLCDDKWPEIVEKKRDSGGEPSQESEENSKLLRVN